MAPREVTTWRTAARVLVAIFLVSGATSLIYETIWSRHLHLVFGTSQLAVSTVLAAFMAGLAAGALIAARVAPRVRRPLLAYAGLEGFIAAYAILLPVLIRVIEPLHQGFWNLVEPGPALFGAWQFLLLGTLLLPPTICMGATLPLLARFAKDTSGNTAGPIGRLYGANTLGAVVGAGVAGFVLLPRLGLEVTTWLTVAANGVLALVAVVLSTRWEADERQPARTEPAALARASGDHGSTILLAAGLAGLASLICEVAWFRLMVLVLGASVYAFSIMLVAFLVGIAIGGWFGGAAADRVFRRAGFPGVLRRLAGLQIGIALLTWGAMFAYGELPVVFVWLFDRVEHNEGLIWPAQVLVALAVMTPPAVLMGAAFPFMVRAAARSGEDLPRPVGQVYAANTFGAVIGAFAGGFLLLPTLHVRGTILAAASLNVVVALIVLIAALPAGRAAGARLVRPLAACALLIGLINVVKPPWNPLLMTAGMYQYAKHMPDRSRAAVRRMALERARLLFYDEGLTSVVTVGQNVHTGNIWLANNGKIDASSQGDLNTQVLLAHLPFVFRPDSERALVIGLASGITAGSVTLHAAPTRIDIAEIEPAVIAASHAFDEFNHRPLEDPRVRLVMNDARNHLQMVEDGAYDLVTSEPSNPWITGVANLFTRDFFSLGKRKLTPDGVWAQWLHTYGMSPEDLRSLLGTFADVFAHVHLFRINETDLVLVGSDGPLPLRRSDVVDLMQASDRLAASFRSIEIDAPERLIALYDIDRDGMLALAGDVERNTDDNMRIEYSAPRYVNRPTADDNTALLRGVAIVPFEAMEESGNFEALANAYLDAGDARRGVIAARAGDAKVSNGAGQHPQ